MNTTLKTFFAYRHFAYRHQTQRTLAEDTRNISPSPDRPDKARLDTAFLADRGVKLPSSAPINSPRRP